MTTAATWLKTPSKAFLNRAKAGRFTRIARVMSGEIDGFGANVERVIIDPSGQACTDGKTIWVPETLHDDEAYNAIMQEAILAHESAHHRYTDFVAWNGQVVEKIKRGEVDPMLHKFTNMLEDARINHLFGQDWKGSKRKMDFTHEVFMAQHRENTTDDSPPAQQAMVAMMSECIAGAPHWSTNEQVVAFMDKVRPYLFNAVKQRDTSAVIRQAKRLLQLFRDEFDEDPETDNSDFSGLGDDDLSTSDVERASDAQQAQGRQPQDANRNRFQDYQPPQPKADTDDESADQQDSTGQSTGETEDGDNSDGSSGGSQETDEDGEDGTGSGEGSGEESEDGEGEGSGSADGDSEGDEADGSGEGSSDELTDDTEDGDGSGTGGAGGEDDFGEDIGQSCEGEGDGDGATGEGDETGPVVPGDGQDGDPRDGWEDTTDTSSGAQTEDFAENWSDLINRAEQDMEDDLANAYDFQHDFDTEMEESTSAVDEGRYRDSRYDQHDLKVTAGVRDFQNRIENLDSYTSHYDATARAGRGSIRAITKEITRRLKGSDPRYDGGMKSGRLNPKQAWKFGHSDFDASKVYQKKSDPVEVTASAIVLIDASGSMGSGAGSCASHASNAAVIYSEVFRGLGFDYEIIDFNTGWSDGTTMRVRKAFGTRLTRMEKACISAPFSGSANADGYAVQWCLDRLNTRDGNRLLIVISDGQPSGSSPEGVSSSEHLIEVTNDAQKSCPGVGLLGVGIAGMDCSDYYPNAVSVNNLTTIGQETLPTLRRMLKKIIPKRG